MQKAIIGRKVGMTQIYAENGAVIPCTVIKAGPCMVSQVKTEEKDGYSAVQLAFEPTKESRANKPEMGHFKKAGLGAYKEVKEFRLENSELKTGDEIKADVFSEGDIVDITGISKGKGFQGVIKRHGYARTATSHGGGPVHRHQGSMGANSDPSRVFPGKKMAGHMGAEQVTILNLEVVKVDPEINVIAVKGAIPGPKGGLVTVRNAVKA
jgi:large subunit ribosomal protein L3